MQARDIFGLLIRVAGFALVLFSLMFVWAIVTDLLGIPVKGSCGSVYNIAGMLTYMLPGLALFFAADWIVQLSYGRAN